MVPDGPVIDLIILMMILITLSPVFVFLIAMWMTRHDAESENPHLRNEKYRPYN